ncbi:hypothetical protein [Rhodococcus wratislaviensis]|uniref:Uncharacterized protein n=1 Tax=Rhodococcus wratislaviensis NBRC 100605 TaxID=1219028 RepID=X0PRK4_RHOWR|nr:hypothetical protein [Rhodococcus wratislaviensis]GAF45503.1 hypothetical protein RW1_022_00830 [Rhodococcus wratislaviensis NBRC 100605]
MILADANAIAARCRQTLLPLAEARGLRIDDHPLPAVDAPTDQLVAMLEAPEADGVVFCTHGEVLDAVAEPARSRGAAWMPPAASTAKGGAWIVDHRADRAPTLQYSAHSAQLTESLQSGPDLRASRCAQG